MSHDVFQLAADYQPTGDQPEAIAQLTEGIRQHVPAQTLLGVTGSGKTFTIANVIQIDLVYLRVHRVKYNIGI